MESMSLGLFIILGFDVWINYFLFIIDTVIFYVAIIWKINHCKKIVAFLSASEKIGYLYA